MSWNEGPAGTRSYAVALRTRVETGLGNQTLSIWLVWDIHGLMLPQEITPGEAPNTLPGMRQASLVTNPFAALDTPRYQAPCSVLNPQDFELVLYALAIDSLPIVEPRMAPDRLVQQIEQGGSLLATSVLPFTFRRRRRR